MKRITCILFVTVLASQLLSLSLLKAIDDTCKDAAIIFARGSGQNPLDQYLENLYDKDRFGQVEPQSFTFFEEIGKRLSGLSVERISLHDFDGRYNTYGYMAVNAEVGFTQKPHHRTDVYNRYYESVADGAEELAWFLEDRITSCPFQQIILGGYSQGAHVVGDALFKLKPTFRPRIAYVALFGDPKFNPRTSAIPPITGPWVRGSASSLQTGVLLARKNYLPDEILFKTSWCDVDDPICANYSIDNTPFQTIYEQFINKTHQDIYQSGWIPQAANEIAKAVKDRTPSLAGHVQTAIWVNKNDKLYQLDLALVIDTTGSMNSMMSTVKNRLDSFISALFNAYWDTRVGIVGFNEETTGYPYGTPSYYYKIISDFTNNKESIRDIIKTIKIGGGGDEPEALYSGLMAAMDTSLMHWRTGAQKKILVITDAPAKDPDPGPKHWTKEQVLQRALELDPVVVNLVAFPVSYPWPYTNQILNKQVDEAFQATVLDLIPATNGTTVYGTRDYSTSYSINALTTMTMQPVATIDGLATGYVNEPLSLSGGGSYDPNGAITGYSWDCNNDGIWEIAKATQPTTECIYDAPYGGLVVLEVMAADGGSAKAILEVNITERTVTTPTTPDAPVATASRIGEDVIIAWQNNYPLDVSVRISDLNENVLDYATGNSFTISNAPEAVFSVVLAASNKSGWSDRTQLDIAALPSLPEPTTTPMPTPTIQITQLQNNINLTSNDYQTATQNLLVASPESNPATSVAGISNNPFNQTSNLLTNDDYVTSEHSGLDIKLLLLGIIILSVGVVATTAITRHLSKTKR